MSQVAAAGSAVLFQYAEKMLASWASADQKSRILMDRKLRINWMNGAAERLFADRIDIENRNGYVHLLDAEQHARFVKFISMSPSTACLVLRSHGDREHLVVTTCSIATEDGADMLGIVFAYPSPPVFADIDQAFSFTSAESKIAKQMLEGRVAEEIAEIAGISLNTVRSHVRSIYSKLDVRSREGFFRRINEYILY